MELAEDARDFTGARVGEHSGFFLCQLKHMLALNYVLKGVTGTPDHQGCDETKEAGSLSLKAM